MDERNANAVETVSRKNNRFSSFFSPHAEASIAVCKANWLYIRRMREGISRNSEAQELHQGVGVVDSLL